MYSLLIRKLQKTHLLESSLEELNEYESKEFWCIRKDGIFRLIQLLSLNHFH